MSGLAAVRRLTATAMLLCAAASPVSRAADPAPGAVGTNIMGDRDAALGLFLAPWKEEERADLGRPPGLQDPAPAPIDAEGFARTTTYYQTGRAYRTERLQRNR